MPSTANLALPYPVNTDPLANMAAAIQSLAAAIDSAVGGAWITYTPTYTNLTLGNGTANARYRLVGKTLDIRVKVNGGSTTSASGLIQVSLPASKAGEASGPQTLLLRHWNGAALGIGGAYLPASDTKIWLYTSATGAAGVTTLGNGHEIAIAGRVEVA